MIFRTYLTTILFLFCSLVIEAQTHEKIVWNYDVSHGLPTNDISPVMVDSKDRVWFGSEYGVTCYDGNKFQTFTLKEGSYENIVVRCFEDSKGRIWFQHQTDLPSFLEDGEIKHLKAKNNEYHVGSWQRFAQLDNGRLFIGATKNSFEPGGDEKDGGIIEILPNGTVHYYPDSGPPGSTFTIGAKGNTCYYFGAGEQQLTVKNDSPKFSYIYKKRENEIHKITQVLEKQNIGFYVAAFNFCLLQMDSTDIPILPLMRDTKIYDVKIMGKTKVYCTSQGIYCFKKKKGFWYLHQHLLKDKIILSVDMQSDGTLWLTSKNDGLFSIPGIDYSLYNLKSDQICFYGSAFEKAVFVGGEYFSLSKYSNGSLSTFKDEQRFKNRVSSFPYIEFGYHKSEDLECIMSNKYLKIWYKNDLREFNRWKETENGDRFPYYGSIFRNPKKSNQLFFYGFGGFGLLDLKSQNNYPKTLIERRDAIHHLQMIGDQFYLGCFDGMAQYSLSTKKFKKIGKQFGTNPILGIVKFNKKIVVGIDKKGVWLYNTENKTWLDFSGSLLSKSTKGIYKGTLNSLWVYTDVGLQKFVFESNKLTEVKRLDIKSVLKVDNLVNLFEIDGNLILITSKTFFTIPLYQIQKPERLHLSLNRLTINDKIYKLEETKFLDPDKNNICFNLGAVNHSKFPTLFFYRINGGKWIQSSSSEINFQALQADDYKFEFKAETPFYKTAFIGPLKISIKEYWWKTVWFIAVCFIFSLIIVALIVRWRINKVHERKRRVLSNELFSLQSQMNPHFTFNSLNSIQSYLSTNDKRSAQIYLADFAILMRKIMDHAKLNLITLEEEIDFLTQYINLEQRRLNNSFNYDIIVDSTIVTQKTFLPTLMLQPFVENAIWHGVAALDYPGEITISFKKLDDNLICEVWDNGLGLNSKKVNKPYHKSTGINNVKERMRLFEELFNKKMSLELNETKDNKTNGYCVRLNIPKLTEENKLT